MLSATEKDRIKANLKIVYDAILKDGTDPVKQDRKSVV